MEATALQQPNLSLAFLLNTLALSSLHSYRGTETSKTELNFVIVLGRKKKKVKK